MYKGVIFDFNGTLFWDTHLHNKAWDIYLKRFNIQLSNEEKHLKLHGKNNIQLINDLFLDKLSEKEVLKIAHEKELLYQQLVIEEKLQLAAGAVKLFETLQKRNIQFTISTASDLVNVVFSLSICNLINGLTKIKRFMLMEVSNQNHIQICFLKQWN